MKRYMIWIAVFVLAAMMIGGAPARAANAVVGNGTAASCTEAAFDSALSAASAGGGTITFNCGPGVATIPFSVFKSVVIGNVTIDGGGRVILNANNADRHFFIGNGITFRLRAITLRDGSSPVGGGAIEMSGATVVLENVQLLNNYADTAGGAIYCYDGALTIEDSLLEHNAAATGGAIYNDGCAVDIHNSTFRGNEALDDFGRGGAIENSAPGALTMTGSLLQANEAADGGGLYVAAGSTAVLEHVTLRGNKAGHGGGMENAGQLTLRDSLLDANTVTGSGGGLWNIGGAVIMERATISGNRAHEGGGVNSYGAQLTMTNVNLIDNTAEIGGGGLYHGGGTAFITNATISGNRATDDTGNGGGIYQVSDDNLTLTNATLAENEAGFFGGGFYHIGRYAILTNVTFGGNVAGAAGDAIYEDSPQTPEAPGVVQIANSVLDGNTNTFCGGLFQSLGHNISSNVCVSLNHPTDRENYGPLGLGPLADNGGAFPMRTMLPRWGSPLIDAADMTLCPERDQRGGNRVGACDIGAVEYRAGVATRLYVPVVAR